MWVLVQTSRFRVADFPCLIENGDLQQSRPHVVKHLVDHTYIMQPDRYHDPGDYQATIRKFARPPQLVFRATACCTRLQWNAITDRFGLREPNANVKSVE